MKTQFILSCEHGGNEVPFEVKSLFEKAESVLKTHRGYDLGALGLFNCMKNGYVSYSQYATVTRLLVDLNRSPYRKTLFSELVKKQSTPTLNHILETWYHPFRNRFFDQVKQFWKVNDFVFHVSVHSFTPFLKVQIRQTDFGILYDPARMEEKRFAQIWKEEIKKVLPDKRTRYNYPYLGKTDGHVAFYRRIEQNKYAGIEFEMNQKYADDELVKNELARSFEESCKRYLHQKEK